MELSRLLDLQWPSVLERFTPLISRVNLHQCIDPAVINNPMWFMVANEDSIIQEGCLSRKF